MASDDAAELKKLLALVETAKAGAPKEPWMDSFAADRTRDAANTTTFIRTMVSQHQYDLYENEAARLALHLLSAFGVNLPTLARELLSRLEAEAWRDISTAPKDGSKFWGLCDEDAVAMFWHPGFGEFVSSFNRMQMAPGYTFDDGATVRDHSPVIHKPLAWMPTPTPPERRHG